MCDNYPVHATTGHPAAHAADAAQAELHGGTTTHRGPVVVCLDCRTLTPKDRSGRCPDCRGVRNRERHADPVRRARYGNAHRRRRRQWLPYVLAGGVRCARCTGRIRPGDEWDLDHLDNGMSHPSHASCNRAATTR